MRMDVAPSARAARKAEEKSPGKLSPNALEGAPLDLLKAEWLCSVAAQRRDELRSEIVAAEQELRAAEAEFRIEEARNDKFEQAVEAGGEAEMRRLEEKASLLEARLRDRLEALQHLSKARAGQQRSPVSLSPTQPCQSPIRSYKIFNTKARSVSPPRHQHSITLATGKPLVSQQCRPLGRTHQEPTRALSGSPRAVSTPVVATPPLLRVAAAAAGAARHQATPHFQQLDDARHRAQVDFWSGL